MIGNYIEEILTTLDSERDSVIDLLRQLVRIPSVCGEEGECARFCASEMRRIGFDVDLWTPDLNELKSHPAFPGQASSSPRGGPGGPTEMDCASCPNAVGVLRGRGGGRSILLNAHTDVVPPGDGEMWNHDPWGGEVEDGRLYGRGALDTKSGLAAALKAVEAIGKSGVLLKGDVIFECVAGEELGGCGTLASIIRGYRADGGIFIEPTGSRNIVLGHRGSIRFRVTVGGKPSALDERGNAVNAIDKMAPILSALLDLKERRRKVTHPDFSEPAPMYIGTIRGGDWFSSIPLRCTLDGVMGWFPQESFEAIVRELERSVESACSKDPWLRDHPPIVDFPSSRTEPGSIDGNHGIVRALGDSIRFVAGEEPEIGFANAGTDQRLRVRYGRTPSAIYGPDGGGAHSPDEYVELDSVIGCAKVLALTITEWCG